MATRYTANRQPGKALPFYLRLRRPNVFDLIREHNLFTAVRDQVLLLVDFDQELLEKRRKAGEDVDPSDSVAIKLLVDNIHSIPVRHLFSTFMIESTQTVNAIDRSRGSAATNPAVLLASLFGCSLLKGLASDLRLRRLAGSLLLSRHEGR